MYRIIIKIKKLNLHTKHMNRKTEYYQIDIEYKVFFLDQKGFIKNGVKVFKSFLTFFGPCLWYVVHFKIV